MVVLNVLLHIALFQDMFVNLHLVAYLGECAVNLSVPSAFIKHPSCIF